MRRARIQMKPNLAKSARMQPVVKESVEEPPVSEVPILKSEPEQQVEENVMGTDQAPEYTELKSVFLVPSLPNEMENEKRQRYGQEETQKNHHVHFEDGVDLRAEHNQMREGMEIPSTSNVLRSSNDQLSPSQQSPITHHYIQQKPVPRSRNVSLCEDEARTHAKVNRERKRFTGKEEMDTKTWKMADLAHYNPRHDKAIFKRERKTSGSSIVTKSECTESTVSSAPVVNAPQVKIGADGKLVIDETSLVAQSALVNHESVWENVEEGRNGSKISSLSFRHRIFRKSTQWTDRETDLFYEVLRCTGSDFGLMHHYLPQRSRFELKAKYNREEKTNWARINSVLSQPAALDETLVDRITKLTDNMETEVREKKERIEYMKSEERRVRQQLRDQKQSEKDEMNNRRQEVRQMLLIAKEKSKEAKEIGKMEREQERQAKNQAREKARLMHEQAKRIASEARLLIIEAREQEKLAKEQKKYEDTEIRERDSLEREAERIIRRLISAEKKEKYRLLMQKRQDVLDIAESKVDGGPPDVVAADVPLQTHDPHQVVNPEVTDKVVVNPEVTDKVVVNPEVTDKVVVNPEVTDKVVVNPNLNREVIDPVVTNEAVDLVVNEEGGNTVGTVEENKEESSSDSSSSSDSDEEALREHVVERETARMQAERRNLEPRKTKTLKKPIYVPHDDVKYAQQPLEKTVEMAKNSGTMFDSADENDDIFEVGDPSSSEPTVPHVPEPVEPVEPIPKAVEDVLMEMEKERSVTPPVEPEKRKADSMDEKADEECVKKARLEETEAAEKVGEPAIPVDDSGTAKSVGEDNAKTASEAPTTSAETVPSESTTATPSVTVPQKAPIKRRMVPRFVPVKKPALAQKPKPKNDK